ncbi:DUF2946 family protein [Pseudomonas sp. CAU 1711]|uniref:DUF2946 family protein n=1 Tax=Pseudomonas sp. CAU 1711 TaxID=3140356 RepID=UPI00326173BC
MPSTRHLQSTARLALLAMFLLLAAPLFSQGLASAGQTPAWLSEMACGEGGHDPSSHDVPPWAQCGYCTLLLSSPALPGALPDPGGMPLGVPAQPGRTAACAFRSALPAHDAPPRAPPFRIV